MEVTINSELLIQAGDHDLFVDGLIFSSDKIMIKIYIEIDHLFHARKRLIYKKIVYIKCMFWQFQPTFSKQLCSVNYRMH